MKKYFLFFFLVAFICLVYPFDELWLQAQAAAENSWKLVPGHTTMQMSFRAGRNEMDNMGFVAKISHVLDEDNSIKSELLSIESNDPNKQNDDGQIELADLNEFSEFKELIEQMGKDLIPSKEGMFLETNTRNLSVKRLRQEKRVNRRNCQAFEVRYSSTGKRSDRIEGTVWIDIERGVPVLAEMQIPMIDQKRSTNIHYAFDTATNQFYTSRIEDTSTQTYYDVNYSAVMIMTFEDYWEFPIN